MIKIAVVDDEEELRKRIAKCIQKEIKTYNEVELTCFKNGRDFLKKIMEESYKADILFCDIEMPDVDGMEVGRYVREKKPSIYLIYLTAHSEYAVESYMLEAYQYILKEHMEKRLPEILRPLVDKLKEEQKRYKIFDDGVNRVKVYYRDIISIYKEKGQKYIRYTTVNGEYRERSTIDRAGRELQSREFMLVERGMIVNMKHVERLKGNTIYMDNGKMVSVSGARLPGIREQMTLYWGEC